jgi:hypothetical protein
MENTMIADNNLHSLDNGKYIDGCSVYLNAYTLKFSQPYNEGEVYHISVAACYVPTNQNIEVIFSFKMPIVDNIMVRRIYYNVFSKIIWIFFQPRALMDGVYKDAEMDEGVSKFYEFRKNTNE